MSDDGSGRAGGLFLEGWSERRRSFLKQIGSGIGLSALGGATIASETASA